MVRRGVATKPKHKTTAVIQRGIEEIALREARVHISAGGGEVSLSSIQEVEMVMA